MFGPFLHHTKCLLLSHDAAARPVILCHWLSMRRSVVFDYSQHLHLPWLRSADAQAMDRCTQSWTNFNRGACGEVLIADRRVIIKIGDPGSFLCHINSSRTRRGSGPRCPTMTRGSIDGSDAGTWVRKIGL
jgi:hypothetical protein